MSKIALEPEELERLTGYEQPVRQLQALKDAGFWRARMNARHEVILERAHYEAVCNGAVHGATLARPQLKSVA